MNVTNKTIIILASLQFLFTSFSKAKKYGEINGILRVAGFGVEPFLTRPKIGIPKGVDMDLVHILAKKFNMTVEFKATRTWGVVRNSSWIGTVGEVKNNRADVGVGHIVFNHQRLAAVSSSPVLYYLPMHILTRKPIPLSQRFNVQKPFTFHSWTAILISLCSVIIIVQFLKKLLERKEDKNGLGEDLTMAFLATFLSQSAGHQYRGVAMNLLLLTWLVCTSLLLMAYECNLRAYLMSTDYEKPIDGPEDLVNQKRALWMMRDAANINFLRESSSSALQKLYEEIVENDQYFPSGRGVPLEMEQRMLQIGAAIITSKPISEARQGAVMQRYEGKYPFRMARNPFHINQSGLVLRRDSTLKQLFDPVFHHLVDNGIVSKLIDDFLFLKKSREPERRERNEEKLSLDHLFLANICLAAGIALAIIVFVTEIKLGEVQC